MLGNRRQMLSLVSHAADLASDAKKPARDAKLARDARNLALGAKPPLYNPGRTQYNPGRIQIQSYPDPIIYNTTLPGSFLLSFYLDAANFQTGKSF
jgi:hypothetical protein